MANYKLAKYYKKASAYIAARKSITAVLAVLLCHASLGYALDDRLTEIEQYPDRVYERPDGAIEFTLIKGDYINNGARAMVREKLPSTLNSKEWVYYRFAIDISNGWPVSKNQDALVMQWRNGNGSPYMSIHLIGDEFYVKKGGDTVKKWYFDANTTSANKFEVQAYWSEDSDGKFILDMNGQQIVDYKGQTLYQHNADPYLAFGLYRPKWNNVSPTPYEAMSLVFNYLEFGRLAEGAPPPVEVPPVVEEPLPAYELLYSLSPDRSDAKPLKGAQVEGEVYVFVSPETRIDHVWFSVDRNGPDGLMGYPVNIENNAPYDLAGGSSDDTANPYDSSGLAEGDHYINALITVVDRGDKVSVTADFTAESSEKEVASGRYQLWYSLSPDRSDAKPLAGATLSGKVYIFAGPEDAGIDEVAFYVDADMATDKPQKVESNAPYDLGGGSKTRAKAFNVSNLTPGSHTIGIRVKTENGVETGSASFTSR